MDFTSLLDDTDHRHGGPQNFCTSLIFSNPINSFAAGALLEQNHSVGDIGARSMIYTYGVRPKCAFFTENGQFQGKCDGREIVNRPNGPYTYRSSWSCHSSVSCFIFLQNTSTLTSVMTHICCRYPIQRILLTAEQRR